MNARDLLARLRPPTPGQDNIAGNNVQVLPVFGSLAEAQAFVKSGLDKGVDCPCCGQRAQRYLRRMYATNASWLIALVRRHELTQDFVHINEIVQTGGDYSKARFWDLCSPAPHETKGSNRKSSGLWRPTPKGIAYVHAQITIPRAAIVFNNAVEGFVGPEVSIIEALGRHFDYYQLMEGFQAKDVAKFPRGVQ